MTPEQERKIDSLISLVTNLTNAMSGVVERVNRLERGQKLLRAWVRKLISGPDPLDGPPRERLPTLNPDDSGSIEIKAFGQEAAFHGKAPVRVALVLIAIAVAVGAGVLLHSTIAKSAMAQERK
jgi:hypothetical protein